MALPGRRLIAVDVARGFAMLMVCLSHFVNIYSRTGGVDLTDIYLVTMTAAPTFMVISGVVLGYFHVTRQSEFRAVVVEFLERGLFILIVARLLICVAFLPLSGGFVESLKYVYITDAVGFNILIGPSVVTRLRKTSRLALACGCWVLSWILIVLWSPDQTWVEFIKEAAFGDWVYSYYHVANYAFPLIPWFGLYLVGTCLGETVAERLVADDVAGAARQCAGAGLAAILISSVVKLVFLAGKKLALSAAFLSVLTYALTSPIQKSPPSVPYFFFYGGCGAILLGALIRLPRIRFEASALRFLAILGRNSLFVFVVQYYLYNVVFMELGLGYTGFWPLYFAVSVLVLYLAARFAENNRVNRYFRIPVISLVKRLSRGRSAGCSRN